MIRYIIGAFISGALIGWVIKPVKKCPTITPNESTIIVVGDTASANVWKREAEVLRLENDSLKKLKAKVRIVIQTQSAPMPVVDSIIRWNWD